MNFEERESAAHGIYAAGQERVRTTPMPKGQKFAPGTRVWIQKELGAAMSHFKSGLWATVVDTYAHAYGGDNINSYCLDLDGYGRHSWYQEDQLHLEEI